jgi:hypothetical protein
MSGHEVAIQAMRMGIVAVIDWLKACENVVENTTGEDVSCRCVSAAAESGVWIPYFYEGEYR